MRASQKKVVLFIHILISAKKQKYRSLMTYIRENRNSVFSNTKKRSISATLHFTTLSLLQAQAPCLVHLVACLQIDMDPVL